MSPKAERVEGNATHRVLFLFLAHICSQPSHEMWPEGFIKIAGPGNHVDMPKPLCFSKLSGRMSSFQLPPITCWCCFSVLTSASPCLWHWGYRRWHKSAVWWSKGFWRLWGQSVQGKCYPLVQRTWWFLFHSTNRESMVRSKRKHYRETLLFILIENLLTHTHSMLAVVMDSVKYIDTFPFF